MAVYQRIFWLLSMKLTQKYWTEFAFNLLSCVRHFAGRTLDRTPSIQSI